LAQKIKPKTTWFKRFLPALLLAVSFLLSASSVTPVTYVQAQQDGCDISSENGGRFGVDKQTIFTDEVFHVLAEYTSQNCSFPKDVYFFLQFDFIASGLSGLVVGADWDRVMYLQPTVEQNGSTVKFRAGRAFKMADIFGEAVASEIRRNYSGTVSLDVSITKTVQAGTALKTSAPQGNNHNQARITVEKLSGSPHPVTDQNVATQAAALNSEIVQYNGSSGAEAYTPKDLKIKIGNKDGEGLRSVYRVVKDDPKDEFVNIRYYMDWDREAMKPKVPPVLNALITVEAQNGNFFNKYFKGIYTGINFKGSKISCSDSDGGARCSSGVIKANGGNANDLYGQQVQNPTGEIYGLQNGRGMNVKTYVMQFVNLANDAAQTEADANGQPIAFKDYVIFPIVDLTGAILGSDDMALEQSITGQVVPSFRVEVYKTEAGRQKAFELAGCKQDTANPQISDKDCTKEQLEIVGGSTDNGTKSAGGTIIDFLAWIIGGIISLITTILYWVFAYIIAPLIEVLLGIKTYKDSFVQVIYSGWLILRNVSNILFIVILLIIGLSTLFQIERNYKQLIVKVVIAAILVNFSLVIGQSVLGIAETVQNQFLPDKVSVIRALGTELMVKPIEKIQSNAQDFSQSDGQAFSNLTLPFFVLWLALAAFFAFIAIAAMLLIRIVALWVLLMLSPLAYVADILPQTRKYRRQWWSQFLNYAFLVIILAFFLNIAAVVANSHVFEQGSRILSNEEIGSSDSFARDLVYLTGSHVVVIAFMLMGLKMSAQFADGASKGVINWASGRANAPFIWGRKKLEGGARAIAGAPAAGIKAGAGWGQTTLGSKFAEMSTEGGTKGALGKLGVVAVAPGRFIKAGKQRWADNKKEKQGVMDAAAYDYSRAIFGGRKTDKLQDERMIREKKFREENKDLTTEELNVKLKELGDQKDRQSQIEREGILKMVAEKKELEKLLKEFKKPTNADGLQELISEWKRDGLVGQKGADYMANALSGILIKNNDEKFIFKVKIDKDTGDPHFVMGALVADPTAPGGKRFQPFSEEDKKWYNEADDGTVKFKQGRADRISMKTMIQDAPADAVAVEFEEGEGDNKKKHAVLSEEMARQFARALNDPAAFRNADSIKAKTGDLFRKITTNPEDLNMSMAVLRKAVEEYHVNKHKTKYKDDKGNFLPGAEAELQRQTDETMEIVSRYLFGRRLVKDDSGNFVDSLKINRKQTDAYVEHGYEEDSVFVDAMNSQLNNQQINKLKSYIRNVHNTPGSFSYDLPKDVADRIPNDAEITDNQGNRVRVKDVLRNKTLDTYSKQISGRFNPGEMEYLGEVDAGKAAAIRNQIQETIKYVNTTMPAGTPMRDPAKKNQMKTLLDTYFKGQFPDLDDSKRQVLVNQIMVEI
jgi:hypothetical protein